jgi:hypothetical protein
VSGASSARGRRLSDIRLTQLPRKTARRFNRITCCGRTQAGYRVASRRLGSGFDPSGIDRYLSVEHADNSSNPSVAIIRFICASLLVIYVVSRRAIRVRWSRLVRGRFGRGLYVGMLLEAGRIDDPLIKNPRDWD